MATWQNNGKLKLLIIVGTRPEIIRLAAVIRRCRQDFDTLAKNALEQIDANGYAERFVVSGKQMYKIGVVFSSDGRGMLGWKIAR